MQARLLLKFDTRALIGFFLAMTCATPLMVEQALADSTPAVGCFDSEIDRMDWFTDIDALERHWIANHGNPRLPLHKQDFCAHDALPRLSQRIDDGQTIDISIPDAGVPSRGPLKFKFNIDDTLAFPNPPGPFGWGMCWLHSRMQRNFTYLANYRPELPQPSREEALEIIERIVSQEGVTEIPGYRNLHEFSSAYRAELEGEINTQGVLCVLNPNDCAARLGDGYHPTASELRSNMEQLYQRTLAQPGDIQFIRTRFNEREDAPVLGVLASPLVAHSWLVLSMEPIRDDKDPLLSPIRGYRMGVIDPNSPKAITDVVYHFGDIELKGGTVKRSVPYLHDEYAGDIEPGCLSC
jgi:hypothetical protein